MLDDVEDDDIVNQNSSRGEHISSENSVHEEPRKEIEQPNEDAATIQAKIVAERIRQMR
jgi:hypothetical protein